MNAAVGVRTPVAVLAETGGTVTQKPLFARFLDGLRESRLREAQRVIARHAHLLPLDHPWRNTSDRWKP